MVIIYTTVQKFVNKLFCSDHMTLESGVMAAEIQEIHCHHRNILILKCLKMDNT